MFRIIITHVSIYKVINRRDYRYPSLSKHLQCSGWGSNSVSSGLIIGAASDLSERKNVGDFVAKATMVVWPDLVGCSTPAWSILPLFMGLGLSFIMTWFVCEQSCTATYSDSHVANQRGLKPPWASKKLCTWRTRRSRKSSNLKADAQHVKKGGAVRTLWNLSLPLPAMRHMSCKARRVLAWSECALGYARA